MGGADDDWIKAAMKDDTMVAELLLRLHRAPPPPPRLKPPALPLDWSVRQRRSKSVSINNSAKKLGHRGSPTTPLSWSGATSFSGGSNGAGGVGSEESSRPVSLRLSDTTRSKVIIDSEKTTSKRSRKKKTLAELKDEEHMLLKERRVLKKEMAAMRVSLDRQRATNENLKRMKIELQPRVNRESTYPSEVLVSGQIQQELTACHPILTIAAPPVASSNDVTLQSSAPNENADAVSDPKFVLPDLNIPFDEPSSDVICGIRMNYLYNGANYTSNTSQQPGNGEGTAGF